MTSPVPALFRESRWLCAPVLPVCLAGWAQESNGTQAPGLIPPQAKGQQFVYSLLDACTTPGTNQCWGALASLRLTVFLPSWLAACLPQSILAVLIMLGLRLSQVPATSMYKSSSCRVGCVIKPQHIYLIVHNLSAHISLCSCKAMIVPATTCPWESTPNRFLQTKVHTQELRKLINKLYISLYHIH